MRTERRRSGRVRPHPRPPTRGKTSHSPPHEGSSRSGISQATLSSFLEGNSPSAGNPRRKRRAAPQAGGRLSSAAEFARPLPPSLKPRPCAVDLSSLDDAGDEVAHVESLFRGPTIQAQSRLLFVSRVRRATKPTANTREFDQLQACRLHQGKRCVTIGKRFPWGVLPGRLQETYRRFRTGSGKDRNNQASGPRFAGIKVIVFLWPLC